MLSYLSCRKKESKKPRVAKRNKWKQMLLWKCAVCEKSRFIKKQQTNGLSSSLGI